MESSAATVGVLQLSMYKKTNDLLRITGDLAQSAKVGYPCAFLIRMTRATAVQRAPSERRTWQRLPLAIPIFVRGLDRDGNDFVELTTAIDISAGGALVATRRELKPGTRLKLEIPCVPVPDRRRKAPRTQVLVAKVLRAAGTDHAHIFAIKFARTLLRGTKSAD
jgi:hypothetical protein